jgi:hypothetical protein
MCSHFGQIRGTSFVTTSFVRDRGNGCLSPTTLMWNLRIVSLTAIACRVPSAHFISALLDTICTMDSPSRWCSYLYVYCSEPTSHAELSLIGWPQTLRTLPTCTCTTVPLSGPYGLGWIARVRLRRRTWTQLSSSPPSSGLSISSSFPSPCRQVTYYRSEILLNGSSPRRLNAMGPPQRAIPCSFPTQPPQPLTDLGEPLSECSERRRVHRGVNRGSAKYWVFRAVTPSLQIPDRLTWRRPRLRALNDRICTRTFCLRSDHAAPRWSPNSIRP